MPADRSAPGPAEGPTAPRRDGARPRVSVALCTCDGARFLGAQLDSLAAQSRLPDELVACDDGSSDATVEILEGFARRAPFPVLVKRNRARLGSTRNFQMAIELCSGDLIATCDQDDVWLPHKVARTLEVFEAEPRTGLVFTDAEVVDEDLRPLGHRLWERVGFGAAERRRVREGHAFEQLLRREAVTGATMTFRTAHRPQVTPFPDGWVHDAWIALVISALAPVTPVEEPTLLYREHSHQQIGASRRTLRDAWRQARRTGAVQYGAELARFEALRDRLQALEERLLDGSCLRAARGKVAHQALRLAVARSDSRARRVSLALAELVRGGYSRYSPGTHYVLKDLFL